MEYTPESSNSRSSDSSSFTESKRRDGREGDVIQYARSRAPSTEAHKNKARNDYETTKNKNMMLHPAAEYRRSTASSRALASPFCVCRLLNDCLSVPYGKF